MPKIIFLILTFTFIFSDYSVLTSDNSISCAKQNDRNESFRLIWKDEFESELDQDKWIVSNNNQDLCDDVFECYLSQNVQTHNGLLIMKASYLIRYSGAKLTSKQNFSQGRFEMRLMQPNANLKSCIYTWDPNNIDWRNSDQIVITCNTEPKLYYYRTVYFHKNNDSVKFDAQLPGIAQASENWFNVYGFEWTGNEIRFFFDDTYGNPIQLNESNFLKYFQLRFLIRISENNPLNGPIDKQVEWDCPAFLIDYVRVYEKISDSENNLQECSHANKQHNKSFIDQICKKIHYDQLTQESIQRPKKTENNLNTILRDPMIIAFFIAILIGLFGICLFFIVYMNFQIHTIKKDQQVVNPDAEYEYISDYDSQWINGSHLEASPSPRTQPAYLSLHEENIHEYVSMNTFPGKTHKLIESSWNLTTEQTKV